MADRTTVLHMAPSLELSHEAREVVDLCMQTNRAGWRAILASGGGSMVLEAERAGIRHANIPLATKSLFFRWRNRLKMEKLIDRERPVLLHAHGYEVVQLASKMSVKKNRPLLIDLTEPCTVTERQRKILQLAANRGAFFRVPSLYMANFLKKEMQVNTQFLYHIPPGIDLQWFEAVRVTPERLNTLHKLWRLPEQSTVLIVATPFAPGYGHFLLLDVMKEMRESDMYLILIGNDKTAPGMRAKIEQKIVDLGLEGKVITPENCTDWPAACWLASLVVAPNAMPRGQAPELLAAQAIGRPVIVTQCGANTELVHKDETAWVIPPENKGALIDALRNALSLNAARRIDLAICTRSFVGENFPMESWRDSLFELYGMLLNGPVQQASSGKEGSA